MEIKHIIKIKDAIGRWEDKTKEGKGKGLEIKRKKIGKKFKDQSRRVNICITNIPAKENKEKQREKIIKEMIQENSKGGEHSIKYRLVETLCCTLETNVALYVDYTLI